MASTNGTTEQEAPGTAELTQGKGSKAKGSRFDPAQHEQKNNLSQANMWRCEFAENALIMGVPMGCRRRRIMPTVCATRLPLHRQLAAVAVAESKMEPETLVCLLQTG